MPKFKFTNVEEVHSAIMNELNAYEKMNFFQKKIYDLKKFLHGPDIKYPYLGPFIIGFLVIIIVDTFLRIILWLFTGKSPGINESLLLIVIDSIVGCIAVIWRMTKNQEYYDWYRENIDDKA